MGRGGNSSTFHESCRSGHGVIKEESISHKHHWHWETRGYGCCECDAFALGHLFDPENPKSETVVPLAVGIPLRNAEWIVENWEDETWGFTTRLQIAEACRAALENAEISKTNETAFENDSPSEDFVPIR